MRKRKGRSIKGVEKRAGSRPPLLAREIGCKLYTNVYITPNRSNPIWGADFSEFLVGAISNSFHIYHSHICSLGWLVGCVSDMLKSDCVMQLWAMLSVLISLCSCVMQLESNTHISPSLAIEPPVAQHPNRSRRVVCSNSIWSSDFSEFLLGAISNSLHIYHSHILNILAQANSIQVDGPVFYSAF